MKRRDLCSSLALGALSALAEDVEAPAPPSTYIPQAHRVEDRKLLQDFMDEFAFADLITTAPTLRVTHIPVLLDRAAGDYGTICGHIARQNAQTKAFDGKQDALIVFRGPHGYISPTWYQKGPAVPTWNFAVVHATGKLTSITDPTALRAFLNHLIQKFETYEGTSFDFSKLPDAYVNGLLPGIVGFTMKIDRLEGKFKLGQDRSAGDREGILEHLKTARGERSLYELTESFYKLRA